MFQCPDGATVNVTSRHLLSTKSLLQWTGTPPFSDFVITDTFCPSETPLRIKFPYKKTLLVSAAAPSHNHRPHSVIPEPATCII